MPRTYRIGQIVPSSNTTMETELPQIFRAREASQLERFSFHSSRMRMRHVTKEELAKMDSESLRCGAELADARVDVVGYACLVAIMAMGDGYHRASETRLTAAVREAGCDAGVVTSAGALIDGLAALGAKRISILTPYMPPLTSLVVGYLNAEGIEVVDFKAFGIADNLEVGRRNPETLLEDLEELDTTGVDAVVLSACVQMPSLSALSRAEDRLGLPVVSAASCTARSLLLKLGLAPVVPGFGAALSEKFVRQAA